MLRALMACYEPMCSYLESTYHIALSIARRIMKNHAHGLPGIDYIYRRVLRDESPSEYPFLFRLAYELHGKSFRPVEKIAAAIHLLQTSTFVLDDIIDMSRKRAGAGTIYAERGTGTAIITGELLQSIAMSEIASETERLALPNPISCLKLLTLAVADVYKGQYLDTLHSGNLSITFKQYYETIFLTTGQFLGRVALVGALLGNVSVSEQESLYRFGKNYGMALQICDDIIDVTFSSKHTGKDFGVDVKMRRMRLPLMVALGTATAQEKLALRKYLSRSSVPKEQEVRRIIRAIENAAAIEHCRKIMGKFINKAVVCLQGLPEGRSRRYLSELAVDLENDLDSLDGDLG